MFVHSSLALSRSNDSAHVLYLAKAKAGAESRLRLGGEAERVTETVQDVAKAAYGNFQSSA